MKTRICFGDRIVLRNKEKPHATHFSSQVGRSLFLRVSHDPPNWGFTNGNIKCWKYKKGYYNCIKSHFKILRNSGKSLLKPFKERVLIVSVRYLVILIWTFWCAYLVVFTHQLKQSFRDNCFSSGMLLHRFHIVLYCTYGARVWQSYNYVILPVYLITDCMI